MPSSAHVARPARLGCARRPGSSTASSMTEGNYIQTDEVEDALLGLARDLLPDTSAAHWDAEWAHELCKDTLARLERAYAGLSAEVKDTVDLSAQEVWDERMHSAGSANDPVAFRAALDGWTRAGLEAMEQLRIRGGAA